MGELMGDQKKSFRMEQIQILSDRMVIPIKWRRIITYIFLVIVSLVFFFPFLFLLSTSLKTIEQTFAVPLNLLPNPIAWDNYPRAVEFIPFLQYFGNSLWITFWNILFTVVSSALVAYGFSRIN